MSVALLTIGDGRDTYHARAWASAHENLPRFDHHVAVDDREHRLGFAGAIADGWRRVLETDATHCLHLELDFTFNRPAPVEDMIDVLDRHPYLVQMALLRQPWNDVERAAGGIVAVHPDSYTPRSDEHGRAWLEHRRFVTTNPCIWPRWVMERGWPQRPQSEGHFGLDLFATSPALHAAYWGAGEEWVTHIGDERQGTGY